MATFNADVSRIVADQRWSNQHLTINEFMCLFLSQLCDCENIDSDYPYRRFAVMPGHT